MEKLNALLQTETAEEAVKRQALLLAAFIGAEEKHKWVDKAKVLLDRANRLKAYDIEGEQEWFEDVVAFLEELSK